MKGEEFKKYDRKQTTGVIDSYSLEGGIVVGYDCKSNYLPLLVKVSDGYVFPNSMNDVIFASKKDADDFDSNGERKYLWCGINNVILDEPKELDLTKILQGCEGVTLWSDIAGEVELYKIIENSDFPIKVKNLFGCESFSSKGTYLDLYPEAKCLLWPSETNRDWSTFKKPLTVKDDDWVACLDNNNGACVCKYGEIRMDWKYILPFEKFKPGMSEEELKKLSIVL